MLKQDKWSVQDSQFQHSTNLSDSYKVAFLFVVVFFREFVPNWMDSLAVATPGRVKHNKMGP